MVNRVALFVVLSATVIGGASWGVASAQTGGTVYACVHRSNGNVRLVGSTEECKNAETRVMWNAAGPQGPEGPTVSVGPGSVETLQVTGVNTTESLVIPSLGTATVSCDAAGTGRVDVQSANRFFHMYVDNQNPTGGGDRQTQFARIGFNTIATIGTAWMYLDGIGVWKLDYVVGKQTTINIPGGGSFVIPCVAAGVVTTLE